MLVSVSRDQTVMVWNVESWECIESSRGALGASFITFSQFNHVIAGVSTDGRIRLWDIFSGKSLNVLQGHAEFSRSITSNPTRSITFSPDGLTLVSGGSDWTIKIWNIQTGECRHTLQGHTSWVASVAVSPNGQTLASSSGDWTIKIWNIQTGECRHTLQGHKSWVDIIAFSPDGKYLVSASHDQTVKLWDINTGEYLNTMRCDQPYEGMNITGVKGLTEVERTTLKALGAIERENL